MTDWTVIAFRFAIYVDLMLLFGLATYRLYAASPGKPVRPAVLGMLAVLGILLSGAGFLVTTASMTGLAVEGLDRDALQTVLFATPVGTAAGVRVGALIVAGVAAAGQADSVSSRWVVTVAAAVSLASLVWSGHGAMNDGMIGAAHVAVDIIHLLATSAWLGALAILLGMAISPLDDVDAIRAAHRALDGFSFTGSIIVATALSSGIANGWLVIGAETLPILPASLYGQLMIVKLLLFVAMLGLAAVNRWHLTPKLGAALTDGDRPSAARAIRWSILLEASAALAIIGLVAWLGTLEPPTA